MFPENKLKQAHRAVESVAEVLEDLLAPST
jgi:hypothetical protein